MSDVAVWFHLGSCSSPPQSAVTELAGYAIVTELSPMLHHVGSDCNVLSTWGLFFNSLEVTPRVKASESPIHLILVCLDCGRKLENRERTHTVTGRTYPHTWFILLRRRWCRSYAVDAEPYRDAKPYPDVHIQKILTTTSRTVIGLLRTPVWFQSLFKATAKFYDEKERQISLLSLENSGFPPQ